MCRIWEFAMRMTPTAHTALTYHNSSSNVKVTNNITR